MKILFATLAVASLIAGCAGSNNSESSNAEFTPQTREQAASLLQEMTQIKTDYIAKGSLAGIGIAESMDLEISREKAQTNAIADIGASIQAEIKSVSKIITEEIGETYASYFERQTQEIINATVYGATPVVEKHEQTESGKFKTYVVVVPRKPGMLKERYNAYIDQLTNDEKIDVNQAQSLRSFYENDPEF